MFLLIHVRNKNETILLPAHYLEIEKNKIETFKEELFSLKKTQKTSGPIIF